MAYVLIEEKKLRDLERKLDTILIQLQQRENTQAKTWMTREEVAGFLCVNVRTVDKMVRDNRLKKHYVNGLPRFLRSELPDQTQAARRK